MALDWDDGNRDKCQKHGVSLGEIEEFFAGEPRFAPDRKHDQVEARFIAVGRTLAGRALFVAFTFRRIDGRDRIRPISARYMHKQEVERYEQESP